VTNRELGMAGEDAACAFLKRRGYRIIDRNYRCPCGELDVVAAKRGLTVFCEVKARSGGGFEEALGAVDARRQGRLAVQPHTTWPRSAAVVKDAVST